MHYAEKRFFAPVSLTCEEHGRIDQKPDACTLPKPVAYTATLHLANETGEVEHGVVRWQLRRADSSVILSGEKVVSVEPYSGLWLEKMDLTGVEDEREMHLWFEYVRDGADGEVVSSGSALFVAPKHYHFADPKFTVSVDGDLVTVHAEAYAKGVCIETEDGDLKLSDNFFDMERGEKTVRIVSGAGDGKLTVRSVYRK